MAVMNVTRMLSTLNVTGFYETLSLAEHSLSLAEHSLSLAEHWIILEKILEKIDRFDQEVILIEKRLKIVFLEFRV